MPAISATALTAMADGFAVAKALVARRAETGVAFFLIDDLSRMSRNTIDSLKLEELVSDMGARLIGASDGFDSANPQSSLMLPMLSSIHAAFIGQLQSKVNRGMDDAFRRGANIQPPGVAYRMVPLTDAAGNVVYTHKGTMEKRSEIDPEAADWIRRGAEMIAHEGKSPLDVARLFNEHRVGGKHTWDDTRIRTVYARERLVGREVYRTTRRQVYDQCLPAIAGLGDGIEPEGTSGQSKLWEFLGKDLRSNASSDADKPVEIIVPLRRPAGKGNRQQAQNHDDSATAP